MWTVAVLQLRGLSEAPGGMADVALPCGILLATAVGFVLLARLRFRFDETKVSWA